MQTIKRCTRCVYDETLPNIVFDANGVCNYCHQHDKMLLEYPSGNEGKHKLALLVEEIKRAGKGKPYDCVIGVSGGCDSSFLVHTLVKEYGLRPLAAHYDNTWNSEIATQNIHKVLDILKVDLFTYVVNNKEMDDIFKAFILSGLKEVDVPTDIALATVMYKAARKHNIGYIIDGHSFRTEGIAPLGWIYMDGKLIADVHKKFGHMRMQTFPNLTLLKFIGYTFCNIKRVRPLYYMDYNKEEAKALLMKQYGWEWYGGHHLENRFTSFNHLYIYAQRAHLDTRLWGHAALVRTNQLAREQALTELSILQQCPQEIIDLVKKRLKFTDEEFAAAMGIPERRYTDYRTYKRTFERLKWFFWILYKMRRVPRSFYEKYCCK